MADPLSVASGVAGLVSLTIQATQLACKYVAEVSHAGEVALQCLSSLSLLRDVLERISEAENSEAVTLALNREPVRIPSEEVQRCTQSLQNVSQRLSALFRDDGKISKRKALVWPFQKSESANLIQQLQGFRDTFTAIAAADSLEVSSKTHAVVADTLKDVKSIKTDVKAGLEDRSARDFLEWILPGDTVHWHEPDNINIPSGAANWFLESDEFKDWLGSSGELYWCHGAPGSGKTLLMSQAIARIEKQFGPSPAMVLSHFCDHRDLRTQTPELITQHLIRQAALKNERILADLHGCPEYLACKRSGRPLHLHEAKRMLLEICLSNKKFFLVVDALDECAEEVDGAPARESLFEVLKEAATAGTRVIVSSRQLNSIGAALAPHREAVIRAPDSELRSYVNMRLDGIEKRVPQAKGLQMAISDKVVSSADGVYLVARLMIDMLAPTTIKNLRQIKKWLAHDSWNLSQMYQGTLTRIMSSDEGTADLARRVLLWLCHAQRPLTEVELQHALATELEDDDFDPDGITPGEFLRSACMGLVICDGLGVYSLFHLTAYEFFRSAPELDATAAHLLISKTCMTYASFSTFKREGSCENLAALEARNSQFALLDYAAKNWAEHASCVEEHILDEISTLLGDETLRSSLVQSFYHRHRSDEELQRLTFRSLPTGLSSLQLACGRGLILSARRQLVDGADVCRSDDQGWTPLITAASYGQLEVVKLLLNHVKSTERCTDGSASAADTIAKAIYTAKHIHSDPNKDRSAIDQCDHEGWSPLFWSIIKGHLGVTEHLLASGAKATLRDSGNWTPLDWAACRADSSLVRLLLQYAPQHPEKEERSRRAHVNGSYRYGLRQFSPVHLAASAGNLQSVKALIDFGTSNHDYGERAFGKLFQVLSKKEKMMPRLSSSSVIRSDDFTIKLFESAIRSGQLAIVKLLVDLGTSLGPIEAESTRRSPLHIAAFCGNRDVCEYLIASGASVTLKDDDSHTPLDLAFYTASIPCVDLLLSSGYASSRLAKEGYALPTLLSTWCNNVKYPPYIDSLALKPKLSQNSPAMLNGPIQRPQLGFSSSEPSPRKSMAGVDDAAIVVVRALLAHGCDINASHPDDCGTALSFACEGKSLAMVKLLLEQGSNIDAFDDREDTALHVVCRAPHASQEIARTLLEHGANINALNKHGRSPLMLACENTSIDIVHLLISHGADTNLRDEFDRHPLHAVCERSHDLENSNPSSDIIDLLLDHSEEGILSSECKVRSFPFEPYPEASPLGIAIWVGNVAAMEALRRHGANPPRPETMKAALWKYASEPQSQIFDFILSLGGDIAGHYQGRPIIAQYLFDLGWGHISDEKVDVVEKDVVALIDAGADISDVSVSEGTLVQLAMSREVNDTLIGVLIRHGATEVAKAEESTIADHHDTEGLPSEGS